MVVARAGSEADPPVAVPPALRPFVNFRRLSGRALDRARRVLDEDDEFRARVRDAVERDVVGEAGWLFLDRPEGWGDQLADLARDAARESEEAGSVEEAARLRRELDRMRADLVEARDELDGLRRTELVARAEAESARAELDATEGQLRQLEEERDRAEQERARAVRDLKAQETLAVGRLEELRRAQEDLDQARRELDAVEEIAPDVDGVRDPVDAHEADAGASALPAVQPAGGAAGSSASIEPAPLPLDRPALAEVVARAAQAADALATALAETASLVGPATPVGPDPADDDTDDTDDTGDTVDTDEDGLADPTSATQPLVAGTRVEPDPAPALRASPEDRPARSAAPERREAVALPVGTFDDSPEAARFWLRHPGMTLAVDGYNVSLAGWPTLALAAQRQRLLDALDALAARTGCSVVVVFDGADIGGGGASGSRPRGVQVRFTAPDVEADDELLALLDALPPTRPVTVASSDRRVADGARRRGASTLASTQLLAVLDG